MELSAATPLTPILPPVLPQMVRRGLMPPDAKSRSPETRRPVAEPMRSPGGAAFTDLREDCEPIHAGHAHIYVRNSAHWLDRYSVCASSCKTPAAAMTRIITSDSRSHAG